MVALSIIAVALVLLLILPLGVDFRWCSYPRSRELWVIIGPARLKLPSRAKAGKKGRQAGKTKKKNSGRKKRPQGHAAAGGSNSPALARLVLDVLLRSRRHLSVDLLRLQYRAGGEDPFDAAMRYGRANALLCSLLPPARAALNIREEEIATALDFNSSRDVIDARIVATLQIWEIAWLGLCAFSGFRRMRRENQKKGG